MNWGRPAGLREVSRAVRACDVGPASELSGAPPGFHGVEGRPATRRAAGFRPATAGCHVSAATLRRTAWCGNRLSGDLSTRRTPPSATKSDCRRLYPPWTPASEHVPSNRSSSLNGLDDSAFWAGHIPHVALVSEGYRHVAL